MKTQRKLHPRKLHHADTYFHLSHVQRPLQRACKARLPGMHFHHADTYFHLSHVQRPPRSRVQDRFAISRHVMPFTPPHTIRPLTPAALGRKPHWGGTTGIRTPAPIAPTMKTRAHSPRTTRFTREPIAPWTPLATAPSRLCRRAPKGLFALHSTFSSRAHQGLPSVIPGKTHSHFGYSGAV